MPRPDRYARLRRARPRSCCAAPGTNDKFVFLGSIHASTGESTRDSLGSASPGWVILAAMGADAELLYAWRGGNNQAGQTLFKQYYEPAARFFANKLSEPPADLVQETLMRCVKGRDRIREGSNFRSYLFSVAYRVLTDHLRTRYQAPDDLGSVSILDLDPSPSTLMHDAEEARLLLMALRSLPMNLQVMFELRYWEQMNSTEISQVLDIPAATVRGQLRQGRGLLEDALAKLAASPAALESTLSDIDAWAEQIRKAYH